MGGARAYLCRYGGYERPRNSEVRKESCALYKEKIALLPDHVKSSMSIGAVVVDIGKHNTARDTFEQVYRSADEAMYRSKRNGKDTWQICTYHGEAEHGAETV